jgi:hypothetical protein
MVDSYTYAKMLREDAERDAEVQAARSPEDRAADQAIIDRQFREDKARHAELTRRLLNNGGRHYWGIMDDWKFEDS